VPAAAVIPAPRAYINVVAVKKPVVGFENFACSCTSDITLFRAMQDGAIHSVLYGREVVQRMNTTAHRRCSETCGIVHWLNSTFSCVVAWD
jgi:hypothetical protein